jgi:hypothetical protein
MDGWSNSAAEGFCLAGFNGSPKMFDSLNPLIDVLVTTLWRSHMSHLFDWDDSASNNTI